MTTRSAAEVRRKLATGLGFARGLRLRVAEGAPHPTVVAAGAGLAGAHRNGARGGGRSSGVGGDDATANGRSSGLGFWAFGIALSTVVCSDATCVGSSHGGDMAGGWELTAPVVSAAKEENRRWG